MRALTRQGRVLILSLFPLLPGCRIEHYLVEMESKGEVVQRKITCWAEDSESKEVLTPPCARGEVLARLYPERLTPMDAERQVFRGEFRGMTPEDIGGSGSFIHIETLMGSSSTYAERFRGDDDIAVDLGRSRAAAKRLADLLLGWFTAELGSVEGFEKLRAFCDEKLRRDIENANLYLWLGTVGAERKVRDSEEMLYRFGMYLAERGYFAVEDLPSILRAYIVADSNQGSGELLGYVHRFVARKMALPEDRPAPPALSFLADGALSHQSAERYLRSTEEFAARMKEWEERRKEEPEASQPEPLDVLRNTTREALLPALVWSTFERLEATLRCPTRPFGTNGVWDEGEKQVRWSTTIEEDDGKESPILPAFLYASWAFPETEFQVKQFGKVVLEGPALARYCLWRKGLKDGEAKEWDELVSGLAPGGELRKRIESFRFSWEPTDPKATAKSLAEGPREWILEGLGNTQPASPAASKEPAPAH